MDSSDRSLDDGSGLLTVPLKRSVPRPSRLINLQGPGSLKSGRHAKPKLLCTCGLTPNLLELMRWQSMGWPPSFAIGRTAAHAGWCRCEAKLGWLSTWPCGERDGQGPPREAVGRHPNPQTSEGLMASRVSASGTEAEVHKRRREHKVWRQFKLPAALQLAVLFQCCPPLYLVHRLARHTPAIKKML
ncbi:hypothetical protein VTJ49DRAFT_7110 [Mycothermus thermophilus]|uniref:Uncharacterized protein n=1 Tax=Humicola insolens TaxID=85995 RepID=A0ABR3VHM5_HUMIN